MFSPSATACQISLSCQNLHSKGTGAITGTLTACMVALLSVSWLRPMTQQCGASWHSPPVPPPCIPFFCYPKPPERSLRKEGDHDEKTSLTSGSGPGGNRLCASGV